MSEIQWLYTPIGMLIGSGGMLLLRYFRDRRKVSAEGKAAEVEVDNKAINLFERLALRTDQQLANMQSRIDRLVVQADTLRTENGILRVENIQYKIQNDALQIKVEHLQNQINGIESNLKNQKTPETN